MTGPRWRVYYDDHSTFDSTQGEPHEAPGLGVQAIVQVDAEVGRVILTRFDWYYYRYDLGEWWASDHFGLFDQLTNDRNRWVGAVRAGRNAAAYEDVLRRAHEDLDFPVKSARRVGERT